MHGTGLKLLDRKDSLDLCFDLLMDNYTIKDGGLCPAWCLIGLAAKSLKNMAD